MAKKKDNPIQEVEKEAIIESDAANVDLEEAEVKGDEANADEAQETVLEAQAGAGDVAEIPAEVKAINTDNETAKEAEKKTAEIAKAGKIAKKRSSRYIKAAEGIDKNKYYPIDEAIALIKETASVKFDSSCELHIKLSEKKGKKKGVDELARGIFHLPNGLGKQLKIEVLDEKKAEEIAKTKKIDFDIAIATPQMMPKLGKIAKILGPKGKMPNPKFGTVTEDIEKVKAEIEKGRVEYKTDVTGAIHQMIGKVSFEDAKIKENYQAIMNSIAKNRIQSVTLSSTMGPGVKVEI